MRNVFRRGRKQASATEHTRDDVIAMGEFERELIVEPADLDNDIRSIRRKLYRFGCVVVRGLLEAHGVTHFSAVTEATFTKSRQFLCLLGIADDEPLDLIADARLRDFVANIRIGQINPDWFQILNDGLSIYDLLTSSELANKRAKRLMGGDWFPGAAIIRRVSALTTQHLKAAQAPIAMHCDAPTLSRHTYSLNFWVPLDDCGVDAPGLQLVPGEFRPLQDLLLYDSERGYVDFEREQELQRLYSSGRDGRPRFVPKFSRGDVAIFHNWIMHASFTSTAMKLPRSSFELRFNAPSLMDFENFTQ